MSVDRAKVEQAIRLLLEGIGEDPDREGLKDTPQRVAEMYEEILGGIGVDPTPIVTVVPGAAERAVPDERVVLGDDEVSAPVANDVKLPELSFVEVSAFLARHGLPVPQIHAVEPSERWIGGGPGTS